MEYIPLAEQIRSYLKSKFLDMPDNIRSRVVDADQFNLWDRLELHQRELLVSQFDYYSDPSREDERRYHESLARQLIKIESTLDEWESSNCQNDPLRMKIKKDEIAELQARHSEVNSLFDQRCVTQEIAIKKSSDNHAEIKTGYANSRNRREAGITSFVKNVAMELKRENGEWPTARTIMRELQDSVGNHNCVNAEILKGKIDNGVKWVTEGGTEKKFNIETLRKTLSRWSEYQSRATSQGNK